MMIESTVKTFGFSCINMGVLMDAVVEARKSGKKVFLHVAWLHLLNNGAQVPGKFKHDWRFNGGPTTTHEIAPGFAGLQNALANAMLKQPSPNDGTIYIPFGMEINDDPDWSDFVAGD